MNSIFQNPPYINDLPAIPFQDEELLLPFGEVNYDAPPVTESSTAETLKFIEAVKTIEMAFDTYPNDPTELTSSATIEIPGLSPGTEANLTALLSGVSAIDDLLEEPTQSESHIDSQRITPLDDDTEVRMSSSNIVTIGNFFDNTTLPERLGDESELEDEDPRAFLPRVRSRRSRRLFKRNNQIVEKGNNKFGRRGILRCLPCRKIHSKCVPEEGADACRRCIQHGRSAECVLTWGPKREEHISRQPGTPDDATISQADGYLLQYLLTVQWNWGDGLLQMALQMYGPTISHPLVRSAVLAYFSWVQGIPHATHVRRAIQELTVIKIRALTDIDLISLYFLFFCLAASREYASSLAIQKSLKRILHSILWSRKQPMPFLKRNQYSLLEPIMVAGYGLTSHSAKFWKLRASVMTPSSPPIFDNYVSQFSALYFDTRWRATPEDTRNEHVWYDLIRRNHALGFTAFLHVLSVESGQNPTVSPLAIQAMEECEVLQCQFEKSETCMRLFSEYWQRPLYHTVIVGAYPPLIRREIFDVISGCYIFRLLAILVLRGRSVQYSRTSNEALLAAENLMTWSEQIRLAVSGCLIMSRIIPFGILSASLVHILSKDNTARIKMLSLLQEFWGEEMASFVVRYWDDPDTHYQCFTRRFFSIYQQSL